MMSTTSKIIFGLSCVTSVSIIYYVHYKQGADRERMHQGVIRDIEAQEMRRRYNIQELNRQNELTRILQKQEKEAKEKLLQPQGNT